MDSLEINAKTVEEATQQALDQLGVSLEEVEVTVVRESKSGILGLGGDDAVVRVTLLESSPDGNVDDTAGAVKDVLEKLLDLMGVVGTVTLESPLVIERDEESGPPVSLNIEGEDLGILIGRRGQTLSCLQYIVRLIVGNQEGVWAPIAVDVEGYKQRRYESLQTFAQEMAEQVKSREAPFSLEPMTAYERRLIHMVLADDPDVYTESTGQGESRKVVIIPRK
jgi:spoIIIJ-associated protein